MTKQKRIDSSLKKTQSQALGTKRGPVTFAVSAVNSLSESPIMDHQKRFSSRTAEIIILSGWFGVFGCISMFTDDELREGR